MTQYAFYLNMDNCIGCKVCGMACMEKNRCCLPEPAFAAFC